MALTDLVRVYARHPPWAPKGGWHGGMNKHDCARDFLTVVTFITYEFMT